MSDMNTWSLAQARDALRAKQVTSVELTEACLSAIEGADALGAFVHKTPELALDLARAADKHLASGDAPDMCGLPIGIKDLFCTKGVPSQAASRILEGFKPEYESTVSQKLRDSGAVMLGKLNMDEFAMGSSNETSIYGDVVNPWKLGEQALTPVGLLAVPPRPWQQIFVWRPPEPIPEARSANLLHLPALSGSNLPMGAVRAGVSCPLPARLIKQAQ